ncbi:2-hydroxyacyl-CoA dehydratase subunit D [Youngiibacter fragilis]|uniref:Benzoyl-CoA reductase n=1 Tax=Youngiibacter fragilis 232.1 TaxID=994573 RepID=V7I4J6_9CLOT|nr:2-hydroxyacyl-CoA dehydratase family protein [Youngiibacter fragilis]ETA80094.1 benzoyl-CoA reductase [Youngiibacter fragilis 232.1]
MGVNKILAKFSDIASNPSAQKVAYLAAGKKVVLVAPVYTPEEIVHSMGAVPIGAWGADCELQEAKKYFPSFICSIMQSILELGIKGAYEGTSGIIIPSLCDSLKTLGQNWKYAVPSIPFIPMTYPQNRANEFGLAFTKAGYETVIRSLEEVLGSKFDDESLTRSIEIYNEHNDIMRKVSDVLALHPEVSSTDRSNIFKSATLMLKEDHTALVSELILALETSKPGKSDLRVITSGIIVDNPSLNAIFDELGIHIVADDVAAESRQYRTDAPAAASALDRLTKKFGLMDNCSVLYDVDKKRADLVVSIAKEKSADGVLVILTKFCDPEEFDYVMVKKACEAAGIPLALIEVDRQMVNYEQARTILETFRDVVVANSQEESELSPILV